MFKIRDYTCDDCDTTFEVCDEDALLTEQIACECGAMATRIMSTPPVHTLEVHMRGTRGFQTECDGSYFDANIADPKTGKGSWVKSLSHKKELLKQHGLYEKDNDERIQKKRRKTGNIRSVVPAALTA